MKCKCGSPDWRSIRVLGLIEAYWNVNDSDKREAITNKIGLIEAYWNVNIGEENYDKEEFQV